MIGVEELISNRERLKEFERNLFKKCAQDRGLHLHLGCADRMLEGFLNIDNDSMNPAVLKGDIMKLENFNDDTVDTIFCAHSLEHLSHRHVPIALQRWYAIMKQGASLYLAMPDLKLCAQQYINAISEKERNWFRYTIYGFQGRMDGPADSTDFVAGQCHLSGYSMEEMISISLRYNFDIVESYQYEGYGTLSFFIHGTKIGAAI
jgi:predicted SAM-dependent methyltransferase